MSKVILTKNGLLVICFAVVLIFSNMFAGILTYHVNEYNNNQIPFQSLTSNMFYELAIRIIITFKIAMDHK